MSESSKIMTGKLRDPVFLCMVGAVILAVGTSLALRAVVAGAGPQAAHGAEVDDHQVFPTHLPAKPHSPASKQLN